MKKNIGLTDRLLRLGVAVLLLGMAWWWSSWILLLFSLFTFFEALASWCVIYQIIGKNSCPLK
ncbi:MAG: DUF2892 domain-containing protein [Parachlamydiaceae bacterium]|nr:DUF2892 domain-containing protein [Parachlamydiaceae bacterium]